jgi:uracil-DNA glycosylase
MRALGAALPGVDVAAYAAAGRDPLEPMLDSGDPSSEILIFGRDPGKDEIVHQAPFVGAGGQKIRRVLAERLLGRPPANLAESITVGEGLFWANTVPYKPVGNKAWSEKIKAQFRPWVADLLVHSWRGHTVLAMGQDALMWWSAWGDPAEFDALWASPDRFSSTITVEVRADGASRAVQVSPLPHPSPLNATWAKVFPSILHARLDALHWPGRRSDAAAAASSPQEP